MKRAFTNSAKGRLTQGAIAVLSGQAAQTLLQLADSLCKKSVGLSAATAGLTTLVMAVSIMSGQRSHVNILVLDTEVYSNTGGQTPRRHRWCSSQILGRRQAHGQKDLALLAMDYKMSMSPMFAYAGKDTQTLNAFLEARLTDGPSIIIAMHLYWHGVDMSNNHRQTRPSRQKRALAVVQVQSRKINAGQKPECTWILRSRHPLPRFRQNRNPVQHAVANPPKTPSVFWRKRRKMLLIDTAFTSNCLELEWSESTSV